jgi:hypothetical protein
MKVHKLIEHLSKLDGNLEIYCLDNRYAYGNMDCVPVVEQAWVTKNGRKLFDKFDLYDYPGDITELKEIQIVTF